MPGRAQRLGERGRSDGETEVATVYEKVLQCEPEIVATIAIVCSLLCLCSTAYIIYGDEREEVQVLLKELKETQMENKLMRINIEILQKELMRTEKETRAKNNNIHVLQRTIRDMGRTVTAAMMEIDEL